MYDDSSPWRGRFRETTVLVYVGFVIGVGFRLAWGLIDLLVLAVLEVL